MPNQRALVLASESPRRRELLGQLGLCFSVQAVHVNESPLPGETAAQLAERLARKKAAAAIALPGAGSAVCVCADTVVTLDGEIFGKPADEADAARMLRRLSGRAHDVYTAVAVGDAERAAVALSRSEVRFRALRENEIQAYWRSGEPRDKAGAYAIQGLGAIFVAELRGSYSGVMGLPLYETARLLEGFGYSILSRN